MSVNPQDRTFVASVLMASMLEKKVEQSPIFQIELISRWKKGTPLLVFAHEQLNAKEQIYQCFVDANKAGIEFSFTARSDIRIVLARCGSENINVAELGFAGFVETVCMI